MMHVKDIGTLLHLIRAGSFASTSIHVQAPFYWHWYWRAMLIGLVFVDWTGLCDFLSRYRSAIARPSR
jgi:hypothetical protein